MAYNKINWENGEIEQDGYVTIDGVQYPVTMPEYSGETPVNADNLNQMDEGIYNLYPTVLYNNETGSDDTITLSDSAANYEYIEIFYRTNDNDYSSVKVYDPNGKRVSLFAARANNATPRIYQKTRTVYINDTTISTFAAATYAEYIFNNNNTGPINATNSIYIVRVIGYIL